MKTIIEHLPDHDVYRHQLTEADRERASAEMIDRLMPHFAVGMHAADNATLAHELERLECLPYSVVFDRMRAIVAAEQAERRAAVMPDV